VNHGAADLTRWYLVLDGVGTDPDDGDDWPVHVGREADSPDDCLTCYDTTGTDDGRSMPTGEAMQHRGVQVRVRATDYRTGYSKARDVRAALEEAHQETVTPPGDAETYLIHCYARIGDVLPLGREPHSSRYVFTVNAVTPVRRVN
jgi:hypothetical protein